MRSPRGPGRSATRCCRRSATAAMTPATTDRARLRPGGERLRLGDDDDHATATQKLNEFSLDFQDDSTSRRGDGQRRARPTSRRSDGEPLDRARSGGHPADEAGRRRRSRRRAEGGHATSRSRSTTRATPQLFTDPDDLDRGLDPGLLSARPAADLRRRLRRQRADGRPELVPVEQLPDRQGDLRHPDHASPAAKTALGVGELAAQDGQRRRDRHLALDARTTRPPPT